MPKNEPVAWAAVAAAIIGVLVVYGLIDAEEGRAITALVVALAPIVGGVIARQNVTPNERARMGRSR